MRQAHEPEIWGAAEAALHLGVQQQNLRTVSGLPDPYGKIKAGTLWRADDIKAFAQEFNARGTRLTAEQRERRRWSGQRKPAQKA